MENMGKIESLFVNQNEYKIIRLLGHGKGGYSYLAEKADSSGAEKVVLKQIHHERLTTLQKLRVVIPIS